MTIETDDLPTLDADPRNSAPPSAPETETETPEEIGPYRILEVLGEGGMGVVYLAEQRHPIARRVAVKVLKSGIGSREVVARFEIERQALAVMDHPGIAKVFDAGVAEGRPYFAMEFVQGVPITKYCDDGRLPTKERVELFVKVCHAVQHAHQKGVIHRDIKPSNVLVTVTDDKPAVKVIDFGIAKATGATLGEKTMVTLLGQVMGTPEYMSPEQFEASGLDVDTRTDVYSLGVMLYQLLCGSMPVDLKDLVRAWPNVPALLREKDPPTPSSRIFDGGPGTDQIARARHADIRALNRQIKGDLDWITLKAMSADRAKRYETANALAMDLQRHLSSEPVLARPPSTAYRMGRFVSRHTVAVAFAATVVVLLLGFAATTLAQSRRIAKERDRAEQERSKATALNSFLQQILASADPDATGRRDITVVEALRKSAGAIDTSFPNDPVLAAAARTAMASTFTSLGLYDDAEALVKAALAAQTKALGRDSLDAADTLSVQATLTAKRGDSAAAVKLEREALAIRKKRLGDGDVAVARSLTNLAGYLNDAGSYDDARAMAEEALEIDRRLSGEESLEYAATLVVLGKVAYRKAELKTAEELERRALAIQRAKLGPSHAVVANTLNELALTKFEARDFPAAEALYKESLEVTKRAYGERHAQVAQVLENLGGVYYQQNRYADVLALLKDVRARRAEAQGEGSADVVRTTLNMATVAMHAGDLDAAEKAFSEAVPALQKSHGPDHPDVGSSLTGWGNLRHKRGDAAGAETFCRDALAILTKKLPPAHPKIGSASVCIGRSLLARGAYPEAERFLLEGRASRVTAYGEKDSVAKIAAETLATLYEKTRQPEKAAALRAEPPATPAPPASR